MPDPISPIGGVSGVRAVGQRRLSADDDSGHDEHEPEASQPPKPPARIDPPPQATPDPPRSRRAALAAFAAQLLGQGGVKRGLRGGPETLGKARTAYLETEWSGPSDRRVRTGRITKTEI